MQCNRKQKGLNCGLNGHRNVCVPGRERFASNRDKRYPERVAMRSQVWTIDCPVFDPTELRMYFAERGSYLRE